MIYLVRIVKCITRYVRCCSWRQRRVSPSRRQASLSLSPLPPVILSLTTFPPPCHSAPTVTGFTTWGRHFHLVRSTWNVNSTNSQGLCLCHGECVSLCQTTTEVSISNVCVSGCYHIHRCKGDVFRVQQRSNKGVPYWVQQ